MPQSTRAYLDGTGATKSALTGSNGTADSTGVTVFDANGNVLAVALDGTDATGVSQAAGGVGIRGWLSTIASILAGILRVTLTTGSSVIGAVTQSGGPWTTTDAAGGSVVGGTPGAKSLLMGSLFSGSTLPTPSAGQQVALQADSAGRLLANTPLTSLVVTNVTPTVTVGTYAAKQCLGGLLTFTGALPTLKGMIDEVEMLVANADTPVPAGTLYLFDTAPSGSSTTTNRANVTIATADMGAIIAALSIACAADPSGANAPAYGSSQAASTNMARKLVNANSSTIWGVFVMNTATTFAGASDVTFRLKTLSY